MIYKKTIKNRDVYATPIEVCTQNAGGQFVSGTFCGAYKLDAPPGIHVDGTCVKDERGSARLFEDRMEAVAAAFASAEKTLG